MLLPLHLSHYLRSLETYSHVGHDFIKSMMFFGFHSMVSEFGKGGYCSCAMFGFLFFFSACYPHSIHIAVFLLAHPAVCVYRKSFPHPLK